MKQKRLFVVISIIALMPLFGGIVFATNLASISNWSFSDSYLVTCGEGKNINYTLDEFIEMYKKSGAYYKSIDVSFSLNDLYLAQLDSQLSVQNGIITQYRQSISQYETQISYYQNIMDVCGLLVHLRLLFHLLSGLISTPQFNAPIHVPKKTDIPSQKL